MRTAFSQEKSHRSAVNFSRHRVPLLPFDGMNLRLAAYLVVLVIFFVAVGGILKLGTTESGAGIVKGSASLELFPSNNENKKPVSKAHPVARLLGQMILIVAFSMLCGFFFQKIGQPPVIGEIVAGLILGPSVLGYWFPDVMAYIFRPDSLPGLRLLSQIGLVFFMFIVGMELDIRELRRHADSAVLVSHMSIFAPFLLGMGVSLYMFPIVAPPGVHFSQFALFMGVAMSITAFPVLARILRERGLMQTPLGAVAMTCAAVDDITAWCGLAVVIALVTATGIGAALWTIALTVLFVVIMLFLVRPILQRVSYAYSTAETVSRTVMAGVLLFVVISAFFTEVIGIHALFGAFCAGVVMPQGSRFRAVVSEKIHDMSTSILLPLFFAFSGLRTEIRLISEPQHWALAGLVILVAVVGKVGAGALAARFTGLSWRDSASLGVLVNTRGLVELVVLNIGYDLGVLSPTAFTIMVIMALATTLMTGPLLSLLRPRTAEIVPAAKEFTVMLAFGPPEAGLSLLRTTSRLVQPKEKERLIALHLTPAAEFGSSAVHPDLNHHFGPLLAYAQAVKVPVSTITQVSEDIIQDMAEVARRERVSMVVLGAARRTLVPNVLGGIVGQAVRSLRCAIGVVVEGGATAIENVIVVAGVKTDRSVFETGKRYGTAGAELTVLDCGLSDEWVTELQKQQPWRRADFVKLEDAGSLSIADLVVVDLDEWSREQSQIWRRLGTSFLIVRSARRAQ